MKKILLACLIFTFAMIGFASAVVPNQAPYGNGIAYGWASYGSYPINPAESGRYIPYAETPVRVGGFFGTNSAFLIGLKPGYTMAQL
jgi:hypothetical protein